MSRSGSSDGTVQSVRICHLENLLTQSRTSTVGSFYDGEARASAAQPSNQHRTNAMDRRRLRWRKDVCHHYPSCAAGKGSSAQPQRQPHGCGGMAGYPGMPGQAPGMGAPIGGMPMPMPGWCIMGGCG